MRRRRGRRTRKQFTALTFKKLEATRTISIWQRRIDGICGAQDIIFAVKTEDHTVVFGKMGIRNDLYPYTKLAAIEEPTPAFSAR